MAATSRRPKVLAIVGPTASGKSALAARIAKAYKGEIIAADSRTIYKGMDLGTAKPTPEERGQVPHWGLDLVEPGQSYSAQQFKVYSSKKIKEIASRNHLPIIVGGTGLYIDGLVFDFDFGPAANPEERQKLESLNLDELQQIIEHRGFNMPANKLNRRHLIRTIERAGHQPAKHKPMAGILIIGLDPGTEELKARIEARVERMFENGFLEEVKALLERYSEKEITKTAGIGYIPAIEYLNGNISKQDAKKLFIRGDWQYARRQRTWFRRNLFIQWFKSSDTAFTEVGKILNK